MFFLIQYLLITKSIHKTLSKKNPYIRQTETDKTETRKCNVDGALFQQEQCPDIEMCKLDSSGCFVMARTNCRDAWTCKWKTMKL